MNRPLRFCMITTFYPPYNFGGDGIFVHRLSNELAQRGHRVEVIHCIDAYRLLSGHEPSQNYDHHPNVMVHGLKSRFGFLSPLATQQTGFPLFKSAQIRRILDKGFDVIHYHNISLVGGPKILEYGDGIKLYTMHDYWLVCPTHVLFRYNRAPCTKPHCFLCSLVCKQPPQGWRYSGLLKSAVRRVDAFIAPCSFAKERHQQMGLKAPIVLLPHFVSGMERQLPLSEQYQGGSSGEPYFLFVGRLEKLKGLQTLIPVFRNYPRANLLIAGKGNYETRLRQLAQGSPHIRFLGHLSHQEIQSLCRQAVALIVPSINFEVNPPLVIKEAFSQRTPVVVRDLGGMSEVIVESGGGCLYNTDEELIAAMDRLVADSSHRNELGLNGYLAYKQKWTAEVHLQQYFTLIQEVSKKREGRTFWKETNPHPV